MQLLSFSADEKLQNNVAEPNCLVIANKSFLAFSKYGGKPLNAVRNLYPSSRWNSLSKVPYCFSCPGLVFLLFPLRFLRALCDLRKRIFICSFFVL